MIPEGSKADQKERAGGVAENGRYVRLKVWVLILLGIFVVVVDQLTKTLAGRFLEPNQPKPIIDGLLSFTLVYNKGIAFGIFGGVQNPFFSKILALAIIVSLGLLVYLGIRYFSYTFTGLAAVVSIFSGALGNIIDRLKYGYVVDFIDFYWKGYHWPAFNLADSFITIGIVILLLLPMKKSF